MEDMSLETEITQPEPVPQEPTHHEPTPQETEQKEFAQSLAELLSEHKGQNVSMLDLRPFEMWTDFFIIATVTSGTHMEGLDRHIKEFCRGREIDIFGCSRRQTDDQWRLIDLGFVIIHLMTSSARDFYELERLWTIKPQGLSGK